MRSPGVAAVRVLMETPPKSVRRIRRRSSSPGRTTFAGKGQNLLAEQIVTPDSVPASDQGQAILRFRGVAQSVGVIVRLGEIQDAGFGPHLPLNLPAVGPLPRRTPVVIPETVPKAVRAKLARSPDSLGRTSGHVALQEAQFLRRIDRDEFHAKGLAKGQGRVPRIPAVAFFAIQPIEIIQFA